MSSTQNEIAVKRTMTKREDYKEWVKAVRACARSYHSLQVYDLRLNGFNNPIGPAPVFANNAAGRKQEENWGKRWTAVYDSCKGGIKTFLEGRDATGTMDAAEMVRAVKAQYAAIPRPQQKTNAQKITGKRWKHNPDGTGEGDIRTFLSNRREEMNSCPDIFVPDVTTLPGLPDETMSPHLLDHLRLWFPSGFSDAIMLLKNENVLTFEAMVEKLEKCLSDKLEENNEQTEAATFLGEYVEVPQGASPSSLSNNKRQASVEDTGTFKGHKKIRIDNENGVFMSEGSLNNMLKQAKQNAVAEAEKKHANNAEQVDAMWAAFQKGKQAGKGAQHGGHQHQGKGGGNVFCKICKAWGASQKAVNSHHTNDCKWSVTKLQQRPPKNDTNNNKGGKGKGKGKGKKY